MEIPLKIKPVENAQMGNADMGKSSKVREF